MLHQFEHVIQCSTVEQGPMNSKSLCKQLEKEIICVRNTFLVARTKKKYTWCNRTQQVALHINTSIWGTILPHTDFDKNKWMAQNRPNVIINCVVQHNAIQ